MKLNYRFIGYIGISAALLFGCGSTADIISTPIENIDTSPLKVTDLSDAEKKNWGHLDLERDTIPGMAVNRAYTEIIKGKKGKKTIVAVIDSGIDIDHEDLDDVIWTNKDEIPNNGKDDDNNGYIDDIHGWNFLGDAYNEQLEYVRILASGDTTNPDYNAAKAKYEEEYQLWMGRKTQYDQIAQAVKNADEALRKHLGKDNYTIEEVNAIKTEDPAVLQAVQIAQNVNANGIEMSDAVEEIEGIQEQINERLNYNLNKDFKGRTTKDD
ncbi:MAG: peptidase S8, partial [Winogradskyella sp.]|nr:peptidase S8 [Winogradskyella sp.]